ncbi:MULTISPECIES: LysR family transcriptional regulator [unclassified Beijerinckia]|uniref:LysR family transcriptional regulator n=1 Tax=unclassified Beijerinckia TaxID=2638183 RepID=UPI00089D0973|nr:MULTISPECIES: LysR family transcriptional regulator [unclassified Beijerinckia]MDH7794272.1 DNA-binding transcriptional LysR family regulator [Beijerinckia sp. GAS462]SEB57462.1 DNA-binding transcriptional regulator, LysR family [Beijerinckia sp. 28-YEA-48]
MRWNAQIGRRLKLRDLHYLLTVVQAGSMAKAATLLSVSQPVMSKVIADMEQMLGVRLLDRSPRGVEPTIYGRRLLASSYAIFDELRQGVIDIEHLTDPAAGELSIGSNEASTLGIVPAIIQKIRRKHPRLFIQLTLVNTFTEQRRELYERKIEFTIGGITEASSDRDFETELLFQQRYFLVAGRHNPWSRRSRIELAELIDEPWILPSPTGARGQRMAEVFRASGLDVPRCTVETSSFQLSHKLLEEGPFITLLPASVLPSLTKTASLQILPVSLPQQPASIGIIKLKNRRLSSVAEIFIETARAVARSVPSADSDLVGLAS